MIPFLCFVISSVFSLLYIELSHLINGNYLKRASPRSTLSLARASPKAANIHNRWWRERSERNLRFHIMKIKRPRRGRTYGIFAQFACVRPLRGRSYHHSLNRRLRCLRQLNQRLWIFAAFGDALASPLFLWYSLLLVLCLRYVLCENVFLNGRRSVLATFCALVGCFGCWGIKFCRSGVADILFS